MATSDPALYRRADQYHDHGHDHVGADRGAEQHPLLGTNHRICELNAAVGLAQLRKLDAILDTQRHNKSIVKETLGGSHELTFRRIPDPAGDSATFLTFMLPDAERARRYIAELSAAGVDGCFYWYDNNWHYLRKWDHLHQRRSPGRPVLDLLDGVPDYADLELKVSDGLMSRAISMLIKLSWTPRQVEERARKMLSLLGGA